MTRERRLTWAQQGFMDYLKDGKWHKWSGQAINGSGLRGLIKRGLIERRNPNEHPWTWVIEGEFRLSTKRQTEGEKD